MFNFIKKVLKCIFRRHSTESSDEPISTTTSLTSVSPSNRNRNTPPQHIFHQYQVVTGDTTSIFIGKVLGKGTYSVVKEGMNMDTLRRVAVKIVDQAALRRTRDGQLGVLRELAILKMLKGRNNIIELADVIHPGPRQSDMFISMELAVCSAEFLMKNGPGGKLAESQAANFAFQVLNGLRTMHSLGVVHRDIKPDNLMVMPNGVLKIGDFGVAEFLGRFNKFDAVSKTSGSPGFHAPEIARGDFVYSGKKVDVWALGITVYRLLSGTVPFNGFPTFKLYKKIVTGDYPSLDFISTDADQFIRKALTSDFHRRPTVENLLKHPWILLGSESMMWSDEKKDEEGWVRIPGQSEDIWNKLKAYHGQPEVIPTSPMSPSYDIQELLLD